MILGKSYLGSTEIEKIYLGSNVVYEAGGGGVDVFPQDNAASLSDLASIGSWVVGTPGTPTLSVGTSGSYDGTNHIISTSTSTSSQASQISVPITIGQSYNITLYAQLIATDPLKEVKVSLLGGTFTQFEYVFPRVGVTGTWVELTYDFVAYSATGTLVVYPNFFWGTNTTGDQILIDKVTITEI